MNIRMNMEMVEEQDLVDKVFEYFNDDLLLLVLLVLTHDPDRRVFTLSNLIKGDYLMIERCGRIYHDHGSAGMFVLENLLRIVEGLGLGRIVNIEVSDVHDLRETIVGEIMDCGKDSYDKDSFSEHFSDVLKAVDVLEKTFVKEGENGMHSIPNQIDFATETYYEHIGDLVPHIASHLRVEIEFNRGNIEKILSILGEHFVAFCQDECRYRQLENMVRLHFAKQIENFVTYINNLPIVGNGVVVPFDVLREKGFEFVKIAFLLHIEGKIDFQDWEDETAWNMEFSQVPITVDSLIPPENKREFLDVSVGKEQEEGRQYLKTIHLVTNSVSAKDVIFLVLNEQYDMPFRFSAKNPKGEDSAIKLLHNIAYIVDAPRKKVSYSERTADNINNGIFRNRSVKKYMETNKLKKPTLVRKSEDGQILVLGNGIHIETILTNKIPMQYQNRYMDKRK